MAVLPSLVPIADISSTTMAAPFGAATYWQAVDDYVGGGAHDGDTTFITPGLDSGGEVRLDISTMPADMLTLDTLSVTCVARLNGTRADDLTSLYAQVIAADGTILTNEVLVSTQATGGTYTADAATFTTVNQKTNKTLWNTAQIKLRWTFTKSKGSDGIAIRVTAVKLDGTYTQGPNAPTGLTATPNGTAIDLAWTAPTTGLTPQQYNIYKLTSSNRLIGDAATFTTTTGNWISSTSSMASVNGRLRATASQTSTVWLYSPKFTVTPGETINVSLGTFANIVGTRTLETTVRFFANEADSVSSAGIATYTGTSHVVPATAINATVRLIANTGALSDVIEVDDVVVSGQNWTLLGTVNHPTTTYTDTAVVGGTGYSYRVTSLSSGAESANSNIANATANLLPPAQGNPPVVVRSAIDEISFLIPNSAWADSYEIEQNGVILAAVLQPDKVYRITTPSPGANQILRSRGVNGAGPGPLSDPVSVYSTSPIEFSFPAAAVGKTGPHTLRYDLATVGGGTTTVNINVKANNALVQTFIEAAVTDTGITERVLSSALLADYSDLSVEFVPEINSATGITGSEFRIYWVELEVPETDGAEPPPPTPATFAAFGIPL